jgi:CubicO group peptidase (beta-lactamase class C family)
MPDAPPEMRRPQAHRGLPDRVGPHRVLPDQASVRYLRIEAKRRLAAGEFPALHAAQAAIAREHGLPTWAALKARIDQQNDGPAMAHLRWVIARFRTADQSGWTEPAPGELAEHFDQQVLAVVPPATLAAEIAKLAPDLRSELAIIAQSPFQVQVQLAGLRYFAVAAAEPPHRLTGLRGFPLAERLRDPRVKHPPPARTLGEPPAAIQQIAASAFADLGLPALVLAGGAPGRPPWVLAQGHADLERDERLDLAHLLPAPGVTTLVTTTAVLRLVAEGHFGLDDPVNEHLRALRLENPAVTVRDLLSHRGGVDDPEPVYADRVPDLAELMGPVAACGGLRGMVSPSNGGYAVLGQLVADVTGLTFARAARNLVLDPLNMRDSRFPQDAAELAGDQAGIHHATCYTVTPDLAFAPSPPQVPVLQAVAGLWCTGADLVRLATGWASLLPGGLTHEALTTQTKAEARAETGPRIGLGWLLDPAGRTAIDAGALPDATAFVRTSLRDHRTHVILTTRQITLESADEQLTRAWTSPTHQREES